MRKWHWGCAAAVLAGAGGLSWYAYQHPDSFLGRCAHEACVLSLRCNPILVLNGQLLQPAPAGSTLTAAGESITEGMLADPIPVEDQPGDPVDQRLAAWIELPGGSPPAGPAPIVIQEAEPFQAPGDKVENPTDEPPTIESLATTFEKGTPVCPRQMPYCNDDEARREHMPRAEEELGQEEKAKIAGWWCWGLFCRAEEELGQEEKAAPDDQDAPLTSWMEFFFGSHLKSTGTGEEESEEPQTAPSSQSLEQTPPYHCPSMCPSSGCPYYHGPCTPNYPVTETPAENEEQEAGSQTTPHTKARKPRLPPSFRKALFEDAGLTEPTVDTMEFRPSDRTLDDLGNNPY